MRCWSATGVLVLLAATVTAFTNDNGVRIIDGDTAPISAAPFMASLRSLTNAHFCGGAIVSTRYVLTAGQCTNGRAGTDINVVVGSSLRTGGTTYRSSGIINHPFFDGATLENDIALIQTATDILITVDVQTKDYLSDARMFGWGVVARISPYDPNDLRSKVAETIPNAECRQKLVDSGNAWRITGHKLCTAVDQQSICHGDEGGVLVTNRLEIIGVASWHLYCNESTPNVYESIEPHRLWILSYIA